MINIDSINIIPESDISSQISDNCKFLLFWDTCSILDIFNFVGEINDASFIEILKIINNYIDKKKVVSFASVITATEIKDNYPTAYGTAEKFISETIKNYNKYLKYSNSLFSTNQDLVEVEPSNFLDPIERMVQNLINKTYFIEDDTFLKEARNRVVYKVAPGIKNGFKDSVVWETCIKVSNCKTNTNQDLFFISSNKDDFGVNGELEDIKKDCDTNSIKFRNKIYELNRDLREQ